MHVRKYFDKELKDIREHLLIMGGKVELMLNNAMKSQTERDTELAERTIAFDHEINYLEIAIDQKCIQVIATRQPKGRDLRFLTLIMKIVTDLERIGDHCADIAKKVMELNVEPPLKAYIDLPRMGHWSAVMIKEALNAFVSDDEELALKVCNDDQYIHDLNEQIQRVLLTYMMEDNEIIPSAIKINYISRCLERIADHATNIAEMVIFIIKGKDIRHTLSYSQSP